jgi:hypothetical protein
MWNSVKSLKYNNQNLHLSAIWVLLHFGAMFDDFQTNWSFLDDAQQIPNWISPLPRIRL